jgi:hypothetical protein
MDPQTQPASTSLPPAPRKFSVAGLIVVILLIVALLYVTAEYLKLDQRGIFGGKPPENASHTYPGSTFVESERQGSCNAKGATATCGTTAYRWETPDEFDAVFNYFRVNSNKGGWSCDGERDRYTSSRDAVGTAQCTNGDKSFTLVVTATADKTIIEQGIK